MQVIGYGLNGTVLLAVVVVVQLAMPVTPLVARVWPSTNPETVAVSGLGTGAPYTFVCGSAVAVRCALVTVSLVVLSEAAKKFESWAKSYWIVYGEPETPRTSVPFTVTLKAPFVPMFPEPEAAPMVTEMDSLLGG